MRRAQISEGEVESIKVQSSGDAFMSQSDEDNRRYLKARTRNRTNDLAFARDFLKPPTTQRRRGYSKRNKKSRPLSRIDEELPSQPDTVQRLSANSKQPSVLHVSSFSQLVYDEFEQERPSAPYSNLVMAKPRDMSPRTRRRLSSRRYIDHQELSDESELTHLSQQQESF